MCVRNLHFSFLVHAYLLFDTELKLHTMYMYIIKIETIISKNRFSTKTKKRENNMQILLFFTLQCVLRNTKSIKSWVFYEKHCLSMLMILPEFESGKDR
jgi:hypothetical protein